MAEPVEPLVVWVYVTASCEEEAVCLARTVVEERLAACAKRHYRIPHSNKHNIINLNMISTIERERERERAKTSVRT